MSGLAGILSLDGVPVEAAHLEQMAEGLAHRGPDGMGAWKHGPVGMVHLMFHTTPESLHEHQPLTDQTGRLCLTLDGRVDNREELQAALETAGARMRDDTDAELVLQAYAVWGPTCVTRIIGEFALVLWDHRTRRLFCARDPFGMRSLYYYCDGRRFLWSSELRPILDTPGVPSAPNEGMIGEYLSAKITHLSDTLYQGIQRLPPAHRMLVTSEGIRHERYWDLDLSREIRYPTDDDYAEHFRHLFEEVVRSHLRAHGPVGVCLSGGLDSSSVVGMAQALLRRGRMSVAGFRTFSTVFPGQACDESSFIHEVAAKWNLPSSCLPEARPDAALFVAQISRFRDLPDYPSSIMSNPMLAEATALGYRTLLTGIGGDEWFGGSFLHYADLIRAGRFLALWRQARVDSNVTGVIFPRQAVLKVGLWPLLPRTIRVMTRQVLGRTGVPAWITPAFARRIHLADRLRVEPDWRPVGSYAQQDAYRGVMSGWHAHGNEIGDRTLALCGLEERHPLFDRRLVEFAMAIPEEQRWQGDQPKYLLRQAMRDLLPERVRQRRDKADFSHTFVRVLAQPGAAESLRAPTLASLGWIELKRTQQMYGDMLQAYRLNDDQFHVHTWPLWMIFAIDVWVRMMHPRPHDAARATAAAPFAPAQAVSA